MAGSNLALASTRAMSALRMGLVANRGCVASPRAPDPRP